MEKLLFEAGISIIVGLVLIFIRNLRADMKDLETRVRQAPSRAEVKEEIRIQQEPLRVLQQEIKEDVKEMRRDIKKLLIDGKAD